MSNFLFFQPEKQFFIHAKIQLQHIVCRIAFLEFENNNSIICTIFCIIKHTIKRVIVHQHPDEIAVCTRRKKSQRRYHHSWQIILLPSTDHPKTKYHVFVTVLYLVLKMCQKLKWNILGFQNIGTFIGWSQCSSR